MFSLVSFAPVYASRINIAGTTICSICRGSLDSPCIVCAQDKENGKIIKECKLGYNKNCPHVFHVHCVRECKDWYNDGKEETKSKYQKDDYKGINCPVDGKIWDHSDIYIKIEQPKQEKVQEREIEFITDDVFPSYLYPKKNSKSNNDMKDDSDMDTDNDEPESPTEHKKNIEVEIEKINDNQDELSEDYFSGNDNMNDMNDDINKIIDNIESDAE